MITKFRNAIAALALTMSGGLSMAATTTYDFGNLLSGHFQPVNTFASLSVTTEDNQSFAFEFKSYDLDSIFNNGAFITKLTLNNTTATADKPTISEVSGDATVNVANGSGPDGSNVWDFAFKYDTSNSAESRLNGNETVTWKASFAGAILFGTPAFAVHVQGLDKILTDSAGSAWYTSVTPIPEPETYAMMLAGLGLMMTVVRRRRTKI
jgi:hypothetical protein